MKSALGPTISQKSGIFYITDNYEDAIRSYELAKRMYPDITVMLVNLSNVKDKIAAVNVDPDLGDLEKGYAVIVIAPG